MVAFGAPAGKVRSKAKSYTEFIKRGTRTAQVTVTINNTGMEPLHGRAQLAHFDCCHSQGTMPSILEHTATKSSSHASCTSEWARLYCTHSVTQMACLVQYWTCGPAGQRREAAAGGGLPPCHPPQG